MPSRPPRALLIAGSLNQTTQLHAVAKHLRGFDVAFTPYYGTRLEETMRALGINEGTICGERRRGWTRDYLVAHGLPIDENGSRGGWDLVVTCSDLIVPDNVRSSPIVVVATC